MQATVPKFRLVQWKWRYWYGAWQWGLGRPAIAMEQWGSGLGGAWQRRRSRKR